MATLVSDTRPAQISRENLLPRSGIGVEGPLLIIAPQGNPVISLDARLLDRVEVIGQSPTSALVLSGLATTGLVASAITGHLLIGLGLGYLAQERFTEARRRNRSRDLLLALGELEVALHVVDGADHAKRIADQLAPYTREAPISRPEVYEDAKRRLHAHARGTLEAASKRDIEHGLYVGADAVSVRDGALHVGGIAFRVDDVRDYALRGANLPLPGGRLLQAAMGLLVVAAAERARAGEDVDALSERIAAYERWTGRSAGR